MGHGLEVPFGDGWYIVCPKCGSIGKVEAEGRMVYFENISYPENGWFLIPVKDNKGNKSMVLISEELRAVDGKDGLLEILLNGVLVGLGHISSTPRPCLYTIDPDEVKLYCFKVENGFISRLGEKINIELVKEELARILVESL